MPNKLEKFKDLLAELFMFDAADLDFGIYRIMNAKRDEIVRFLDNDLLPQVRTTLAELKTGDRTALERQLEEAIQQARAVGIDPEIAPRVKELRAQFTMHPDLDALENEVFLISTTSSVDTIRKEIFSHCLVTKKGCMPSLTKARK